MVAVFGPRRSRPIIEVRFPLDRGGRVCHCVDVHYDSERIWQAIEAEDPRFDGWFFCGVKTTGIYCRPSCPARTPKRENVRFFLSAAAAQSAGFRACKRCRPDATPGSPEWDLRADLVGRAMRFDRRRRRGPQGRRGSRRRAWVTPSVMYTDSSWPSSARARSRSLARSARRPRASCWRRRRCRSRAWPSPRAFRACGSSTRRSARCSR